MAAESSPRSFGRGGLGKGLAGILGDSMRSPSAPEVSSLLGDRELRRDPAVRRLVTDIAVGAMADLFGTDVVFIVRRDTGADLPVVACRLPSGWRPDDPAPFEVSGRLWAALDADNALTEAIVDGDHLLVSRQENATTAFAGAILRTDPFTEDDKRIIVSLVGSVARALDDRTAIPAGSAISLSHHWVDGGVHASVGIDTQNGAREASSVAPDLVNAVAQCSAALCEPAMSVRFVGQTDVDERLVTLAVVDQPNGGPLFGLSVGEPSVETLAAEAVFSAAAVVDASPF